MAEEIQKLDILEESENLMVQQLDTRKQLKLNLSNVIADEEVLWKSKARQQWLNEIVNWCSKAGVECVGVKADFEKAYNKVSWGFLRKVMIWLGASNKWCGWIDQCIFNAKVAILVNGAPSKWIKTKRGLRQGDPLSPYLFLLVAEGPARVTNRAVCNNLLMGLGPTATSKVAIIQYADDTIFFCEAKRRQVRNLLFVWQLYEWASGLKINRDKSELLYLGSREDQGVRLAEVLGCKLGSLPIRYLGLPLSNRLLRKEDWWPIIERVERRVGGWQAKLLSQGSYKQRRPLLNGTYYSRRRPLGEGASFRPYSQWWRNVLANRALLKCGISFSIGDGHSTNFWSDIWVEGSTLRSCYPNLTNAVQSRNYRVKECYGRSGWRWHKILADYEPSSQADRESILKLKDSPSNVMLSATSDVIKWRWTHSEMFIVNSLNKFLQDGGVKENSYSQLWMTRIPLKVKIFVWLVLKRKVLTKNNLLKRGWNGELVCVLCSLQPETVDHLFVGCEFTCALLESQLSNKYSLVNCTSVTGLWGCSRLKGGVIGRLELTTIATLWWTIWLERNMKVFEHKKRNSSQLLRQACELRYL
ncbi:uncharacterized protein LOC109726747 [Ananas comosus]|uniref:Uncharacterized protein LOC109726747 n=1 Tax=Ananas comosus TaxID=4615 RepID=A0A6P5H2M1_ANACO|nr:uncharacterized protein LOC109726747 [Ananas comosus]